MIKNASKIIMSNNSECINSECIIYKINKKENQYGI